MKALPATALRRNGADYERTYHHIVVEQDVSLDDLLRPGFWVHHVGTLRVNDIIDVVSDVLDVQLRVVGKGIGLVNMRPRMIWAKDAVAGTGGAPVSDEPLPGIPDGYEIKKGPRGRWRVFQKDPLIEVAGNIIEEREAIIAARAHFQSANSVAV